MELTDRNYKHIAPFLPVQQGNMRVSNPQVLNAVPHVAGYGCKLDPIIPACISSFTSVPSLTLGW